MTQHSNLSEERWSGFGLDQQILMIANEMNRASSLLRSGDIVRTKNCYERVLQLTDLTVGVQTKSTLRRELLRWRDLIAQLHVEDTARPKECTPIPNIWPSSTASSWSSTATGKNWYVR